MNRMLIAAVSLLGSGAVQAAGESPVAPLAEVAFVSIRSGDAQIYTRDSSGQIRAVTQDKSPHGQPAWASNNRLAYSVSEGGTSVIYVTDENGGSPQRLTSGAWLEQSPSWSPDARFVAFYSKPMSGGATELTVVDVTTRQALVLARNAGEMGPTAPSWSADGRRLAFIATDEKDRERMQVWVVDRVSGAAKNVSAKYTPRGGVTPNLSPDGRKVLWVADMRGRRPVVATDVDSGESTDLTPEKETANETPRWSPDGRRIVFASLRDTFLTGRNEIFVMNADGSNVRNISRHEAEDFDPKWSADGQRVVFASLRTGTSLLYETDPATGTVRPVSVHASHDMDHMVRPLAMAKHSSAPKAQ